MLSGSILIMVRSLTHSQTGGLASKRRIDNRSDEEASSQGAKVKWHQGKIRQKRSRVVAEDEPSQTKAKPGSVEHGLLPAVTKVATPDQIKFYEGEIRELLELAQTGVRLYVLCRNAFPESPKLSEVVKKVFSQSCKAKYGKSWKGTHAPLRFNHGSQIFRADKSPEFTKGISTLVNFLSSVLGSLSNWLFSFATRLGYYGTK